MNCEILAVGTELLLGNIVNSNAQFLSRELAALGINVLYHTVVGDNEERLKQAFSLAYSRADVVLVTGGLGPTTDDITKEVIFDELGLETVFNQYSYERITDYFEKRKIPWVESNKKQAYFPEKAIICNNDYGTAPGCIIPCEQDGKTIVILPGPPREMQPMFTSGVRPYFKKKVNAVIISKTICLFDVGEAKAEELVKDLITGSNPTAAFYAKTGIVQIRVTAKAEDVVSAKRILRPLVNKISERLSDKIYGYDNDTLESVVVTMLKDMGLTVAVAESCTGGLISEKITNVPGSSRVLGMGICTYSNEAKHRLLGVPNKVIATKSPISGEVARLMAEGVRKKAKADIGVSATGIAGPGGALPGKPVGTVFIAVSYKNNIITKKLNLGKSGINDREYIRELAALYALDLIRTSILRENGMLNKIPEDKEDKKRNKKEEAPKISSNAAGLVTAAGISGAKKTVSAASQLSGSAAAAAGAALSGASVITGAVSAGTQAASKTVENAADNLINAAKAANVPDDFLSAFTEIKKNRDEKSQLTAKTDNKTITPNNEETKMFNNDIDKTKIVDAETENGSKLKKENLSETKIIDNEKTELQETENKLSSELEKTKIISDNALNTSPQTSVPENEEELINNLVSEILGNDAVNDGDITEKDIKSDINAFDESSSEPINEGTQENILAPKIKNSPIRDVQNMKSKKKYNKKKLPWPLRILSYIVPWKGDSKGEIVRKSVLIASVLIFGISMFSIWYKANQVVKLDSSVADMQNTYGATGTQAEVDGLPFGALSDFASLYATNHDTIGWISIPGADINYVVMQSTDCTNPAYDKYLNRIDWQGNQSNYGSIFADCRGRISYESMPNNTIIYGHNMYPIDDNLFFTHLIDYQSLSYCNANPIVYFDTLYKKMEWKIFAVMFVDTDISDTTFFDYIQDKYITLSDEDTFNEYYSMVTARSLVDSDVDVVYGDKLITLSTCESRYFTGGRLVVFARLLRDGESSKVEFTANTDAIMPDAWNRKYGGSILKN